MNAANTPEVVETSVEQEEISTDGNQMRDNLLDLATGFAGAILGIMGAVLILPVFPNLGVGVAVLAVLGILGLTMIWEEIRGAAEA